MLKVNSWGGGTAVLCSAVMLMLVGCGGDKWTRNLPATATAKGKVTLDGKPVEGASVVFSPADGGKYSATALSGKDGTFSLSAFPSKSGAVPGQYNVTVSKTIESSLNVPKNFKAGEDSAHAEAPENASTQGWTNALPQKYASATESGIRLTVPEGGATDLDLELSSK